MTPADLAYHLAGLTPGELHQACQDLSPEDLAAVERLLQRAWAARQLRELNNPLRGLWAGAELRRDPR